MVPKKKFLEVYNKNEPSKWVKFIYKHFSKSSYHKEKSTGKIFSWLLGGLFLIGFFGTVLNIPTIIIAIITISMTSILLILVGCIGSGILLNNKRIKKIAKELNINLSEYNKLSDKYLK